ncbi:hypothetical protein FBUS_01740 [Fasciolopsis buskii]|uniref:Uncharacterized protein n=1 Tax=Fasciolopsis buskii TaxID=27845 RepID=A0A8E0VL18_9TREM|nr:hypothetical protein FBUS_01740 [Fasciolopsis buski]
MKFHHSEQILRNTHLENSLRQAQESQNSLVEKIQSLESCLSEKNQQLADLVEVIHEYEKVIDERQTVIMTKSEEVNRVSPLQLAEQIVPNFTESADFRL